MLNILLFLSLFFGPVTNDDLMPSVLPIVIATTTIDPASNKIVVIEEIDQIPLDVFIHHFGHIKQNTINEYGAKGYVTVKLNLVPMERRMTKDNENTL